MIGFGVGSVELEDRDALVDRLVEFQSLHDLHGDSQSTGRGASRPLGHLVVNVDTSEHGALVGKVSPIQSLVDLTLASIQRLPPSLLFRLPFLHLKPRVQSGEVIYPLDDETPVFPKGERGQNLRGVRGDSCAG